MGRKKSQGSKGCRRSERIAEIARRNAKNDDNNYEKSQGSKDSRKSGGNDKNNESNETLPPHINPEEAKCVICLETATNKSFTEDCCHVFCLYCIIKWCKVKPQCPLCQKKIQSIIYNVRSLNDYDRFVISNFPAIEDTSPLVSPNITLQQLENFLCHRMGFALYSITGIEMGFLNPEKFEQPRRAINSFRQMVYSENLWVIPNPKRVRKISPYEYRWETESTDRLVTFLNRDLSVLMPDNDCLVIFVIELILALIPKYDIKSKDIRSIVQGYTGTHTSHFLHEFHNFAISIYESVDIYDKHVQYRQVPRQALETVSSPNNKAIPVNTSENKKCDVSVPTDSGTSLQSSTSNGSPMNIQGALSEEHSKESVSPNKLTLEKNIWKSYPNTVPFEFSGPSTSRGNPFFQNIPESSETDDDEIQIIKIIKPKLMLTRAPVNISYRDEKSNQGKHPKTTMAKYNDQASDAHAMNVSVDDSEVMYGDESEDAKTVSKKRRKQ